ncbi:MAG TPA: hypothetical protein VN774_08465 [Candidatus Limnocylindrales bacterium]|nr:hypothetical protein [Candidatus Limnocylindrales bacterium]
MNPSTISEQIERILRSQSFASKSQLRKLLEVLFKHMEEQAALKPEVVIRELWPDEVRTKRAADVATEMNRLRHALQTYYESEGKSDPITVHLPRRAPGATAGTQEKRWIVAMPRNGTEILAAAEPAATAQPKPRWSGKAIAAAAAAAAALCVAIGAATYIAMRVWWIPERPRYGRIDGSTLTIFDVEGKELWRKTFPEGFEPGWYTQSLASRLWFGDLEGKGRTSVLFTYLPVRPESRSSTLICYSDRGKERWRWTPGRELPEFGGSPATFRTVALAVLKATDKRPPRMVVSSQLYPWWPNQIALLDSNGKTIAEYWHSGVLSSLALADLDGDGKEEIVGTGVAIGYHQATLAVLDPDKVFGASVEAARPDLEMRSVGVGQERLRLLFPRSDLNKALFQFNMAAEPTIEHGSIRLTVQECITPSPSCPIWYEFERGFHLVTAYAGGDEFRSAHERFYQTGKDAHPLSAEEQAAFSRVRCLVGCTSEFVPLGSPAH